MHGRGVVFSLTVGLMRVSGWEGSTATLEGRPHGASSHLCPSSPPEASCHPHLPKLMASLVNTTNVLRTPAFWSPAWTSLMDYRPSVLQTPRPSPRLQPESILTKARGGRSEGALTGLLLPDLGRPQGGLPHKAELHPYPWPCPVLGPAPHSCSFRRRPWPIHW